MFSCIFFLAEDGMLGATVTGVETCALPISSGCGSRSWRARPRACSSSRIPMSWASRLASSSRSEERRVGNECRDRRAAGNGRNLYRKLQRAESLVHVWVFLLTVLGHDHVDL